MRTDFFRSLGWASLALLTLIGPAPGFAAPTVVTDTGQITDGVDHFRSLLGNLNAPGPGEQPTGRREINWDAVPDALTNTDTFPAGFFNTPPPAPSGRQRGLVMSTPGSGLRVSDGDFNDIDASYGAQFNAFSASRTFMAAGTNTVDVFFQVSGEGTPASVKGFGAVFSDVDRFGSARIEVFQGTISLGAFEAPARSDADGLSFVGVVFTGGEWITRVRITSGEAALAAGRADISDNGASDLVVMDDFIYGEPHTDSDGDGALDANDSCLPSDTRVKVNVNRPAGGLTSIDNRLVPTQYGCTIQDLVNRVFEESEDWTDYRKGIAQLAKELRKAKVITKSQSQEMIRQTRSGG
jgi:hypothetical protein